MQNFIARRLPQARDRCSIAAQVRRDRAPTRVSALSLDDRLTGGMHARSVPRARMAMVARRLPCGPTEGGGEDVRFGRAVRSQGETR